MIHGAVTSETSILDYPSDNEYLYNQYVYNQPTIKPRTSLTRPATMTSTSVPSSNLRYHPAPATQARVSNFYGQAAPQFISNHYHQYHVSSPGASNQQPAAGALSAYHTSGNTVQTPSNRVNVNTSSAPANPVNTSVSRYINPGSIETTI